MFDLMFDSLRQATDATLKMQQEMVKNWASQVPGLAGSQPPAWSENVQKFQKKWAETVGEVIKRQARSLEVQFGDGLKSIEAAFRLPEAKDPEELRAKTVELWRQSFDCIRKAYEAQMHDLQAAVTSWTELVTKKGAA